jgi:hypothetical protein
MNQVRPFSTVHESGVLAEENFIMYNLLSRHGPATEFNTVSVDIEITLGKIKWPAISNRSLYEDYS